jgi:HAD superfamily hydrolase (TIGR01450 family)
VTAARPVVCCDLDGVLWRGDRPIPGSAEAITALRDAGVRVAFLTNNSSRTVDVIIGQLRAMEVDAEPADVLTSAQAATRVLTTDLASGARVLACAGPGVVESLLHAGFQLVTESPADAVVVGWHHDFDFDRLDRASAAVRAGARFVATNVDATYPGADHLLPGAGAIVAAIATASGVAPLVAGKPEPPTVALVRERLGPVGVMVGDRPSTDGALATALGWPFALVLSGVTRPDAPPGGEGIPDPPPPFLGENLAALLPDLLAALTRGG